MEQRAPRRRAWGLLLLLVFVGLWSVATSVRLAFADLLGTVTGGHPALGTAVGLLVGGGPLVATVLVLVGARSDAPPRWSSALMVTSLFLPILLSTWAGRYAPEDEDVRAAFEQQAPGYLTGHLIGLGVCLGLLALFGVFAGVAMWRDHRARQAG